MAAKYTPREVQDKGEKWLVIFDVLRDDGTTTEHWHWMPKDIMEWRAAEYDIADPATLLDIVLAEPFLTDEDWARGMPFTEAVEPADGRADHIARCAQAKLRHRMSTRPTAGQGKAAAAHPLDVVLTESPLNPEAIAIKRQHSILIRTEHRKKGRDERLPTNPQRERERVARLRELLLPERKDPAV